MRYYLSPKGYTRLVQKWCPLLLQDVSNNNHTAKALIEFAQKHQNSGQPMNAGKHRRKLEELVQLGFLEKE